MYVRSHSSSRAPLLKIVAPLFIVLGITLLSGCAKTSAQLEFQSDAEAYLHQHAADLFPADENSNVFRMTDIAWVDDHTALVTFDGGDVEVRGSVTVMKVNGRIMITSVRREDEIREEDGYSSAMTVSSALGAMSSSAKSLSVGVQTGASLSASAAMRSGAGIGEFCGGIAALPCQEGLRCKADGTYPDAGGTCVKS